MCACTCVGVCKADFLMCMSLCLEGMYMSAFFHNEGHWCSLDISWVSKSSLSLQTLLVISSVCDIASKVHGLEFSPLGRVLTFVFALLTIWDEGKSHVWSLLTSFVLSGPCLPSSLHTNYSPPGSLHAGYTGLLPVLNSATILQPWGLYALLHLPGASAPSTHSLHLCKVTQLCLTLWDPMDCSPPGSSIHGILQAGILEWAAMPSSRGSSQPRDWTHISHFCCTAGRFFTAEPPGKSIPTLQILATIELPPENPLGPLFQFSFMQNKPPQKLGA